MSLFLLLILFVYLAWTYIGFIDDEKRLKETVVYKQEAALMQKNLSRLILSKQKSTMAMALTIVNDKELAKSILTNNIDQNYFKNLIENYKVYTNYQNIWVHIIGADLKSLHRSWSPEKGDNLALYRDDIVSVAKNKKPIYSISAGKFELSIKAIIPVILEENIVGYLEVISHFNSIAKELEKSNIESAVLLNKEYSEKLEFPFTDTFIKGYYVANMNIPESLITYLQRDEVENHFISKPIIENEYLISSYALKSLENKILGHYLMFKKTDKIATNNIDFFVLQWMFFGVLSVMALAGIVNIVFYYLKTKQKRYYKSIMDASTNIVVIGKNNIIEDTNKAFFDYFDKYKTLNDFKEDNKCICDLFEKEEGYLQGKMHGVNWVEFLIGHPNKRYKVKIKHNKKISYFTVTASMISDDKNYYSAVFSDITNEENYRKELEHLSTTDSLTNIKNRHYFSARVEDEIKRYERYKTPFSLIMFDIDHFKQVNDTYGHDIGDRVLVEYTRLTSSVLRESDIFCRVGGEEFIIILPNTHKKDALNIATKIRIQIEIHEFTPQVTASFGVVEFQLNETFEQCFKQLDRALYKAKDDGRNVVIAG